jgi:type III restriction enzyme
VAAILLAEGAVDRVLVLCPSNTIEYGLLKKFKELASNSDLRDALPPSARVATPRVINASESIVNGAICVENYHAILESVKSSIRESLKGKGARVAVLNDEAHHVANESGKTSKKWKEFLHDPGYGFRFVVGVSGTCYVGDDYFADVVHRYSLRQAIEEKFVKKVEYVDELPAAAENPEEKWQLIYNRHKDWKKKLKARGIRPRQSSLRRLLLMQSGLVKSYRTFCRNGSESTRARPRQRFSVSPQRPSTSQTWPSCGQSIARRARWSGSYQSQC